ncbi:MAG: hypothetical protein Q4P36_00780 [Bowdeniella nasicola]|nr:hypothetical protein [Bowdeniella nasicola]
MPEAVAQGPIWLMVAFLFVVVFFRAQATYWLGRGVAAGVSHSRREGRIVASVRAWFEGPVPARGKRALERWGLLIIPLSFLTVGFQTAVNAGAGMLKLSWRRYTVAMLPGAVVWALLYGLGLLAVWVAALNALAGSWWSLAGVCVLILAAFLTRRYLRDRRTAAPTPSLVTPKGPRD